MNEPTIGRLLGLVEKTGDKVIVTDPAGDHPYVLMSLDQYERLIESVSKPTLVKPVEKAQVPRVEAPAYVEMPVQAPERPMPTTRSVQHTKPAAVQGFAKPADLWRSKLGLEAVEPPVPELFKPATARPKVQPMPRAEAQFEVEGEEQFYLEPIE